MACNLSGLSNSVLMRELSALVAQDRKTTARLLAHLAEVDFRRLYLQAGYPTMRDYCIQRLRFSEDAAYKRIQAARLGRRFPILFEALEMGWLHLGAIRLLAPHLTAENAKSLVAEATHRTCHAIEIKLAELFPQTEAMRLDEGIAALGTFPSVEFGSPPTALATWQAQTPDSTPAPSQDSISTPPIPSRSIVPSLLLSHVVPPNDVASVLDRALDALREKLRKQKFGSGRQGRPSKSRRYVPVHVKDAVWRRDGGRCIFVAPDGHRCEATKHLEFDHVFPLAKGGKSTVENLRLRCRGHNQLEADRVFGKQFMDGKRT